MKRFSVLFALILASFGTSWGQSGTQSRDMMKAYLLNEGIRITEHNRVDLYMSGKEKFASLFRDIGQARDHIHMEYFNFRNDSIARTTFEHLSQASRRGVACRAMFDAFGNSSNNRPLKKKHLKEIRNLGVEIVKYDPIVFPWINHAMSRDHRKIVVLDGKVAFTGGMNVADYYVNGLEGVGSWHDLHMRIEGQSVREFQDIFLSIWNRETHETVQGTQYYPDLDSLYRDKEGFDVEIAVVNRESGKTPGAIRKAYAAAIDAATDSIQIVNPYFVPTHRVKKAIKRALKRGVKVQIMIPDKSDIHFTPDAAKYQAHRLMKLGAKVYLFQDGFLHSKAMTVDGTFSTIGTANLNSRSLRYDLETNAFIFHSGLTIQLEDMFRRDARNSVLMDRSYWKTEVSPWKKFVGWLGNAMTPFL